MLKPLLTKSFSYVTEFFMNNLEADVLGENKILVSLAILLICFIIFILADTPAEPLGHCIESHCLCNLGKNRFLSNTQIFSSRHKEECSAKIFHSKSEVLGKKKV